MATMLSIGEFSKVTGLTIKTLRLYDEKGLLRPAAVGDESGYRYYDGANVERARVIKELRELDFSLADIGQILEAGSDEGDIVAFLEKQKAVIAQKLERFAEIHRALESVVRKEREAIMVASSSSFDIQEKDVAELLVAGIRAKGRYPEAGARIGKIARAAGRLISGPPMSLYWDGEFKEEDADFESCFPVKQEVKKEGIVVHRLEGGRCVALMHRGPYGEIGRTYQKIFEYMREKKLEPKIPCREVYLKGPGMIFRGNPKNYLTEVQVLVAE